MNKNMKEAAARSRHVMSAAVRKIKNVYCICKHEFGILINYKRFLTPFICAGSQVPTLFKERPPPPKKKNIKHKVYGRICVDMWDYDKAWEPVPVTARSKA